MGSGGGKDDGLWQQRPRYHFLDKNISCAKRLFQAFGTTHDRPLAIWRRAFPLAATCIGQLIRMANLKERVILDDGKDICAECIQDVFAVSA
jgi:hypothetical protein